MYYTRGIHEFYIFLLTIYFIFLTILEFFFLLVHNLGGSHLTHATIRSRKARQRESDRLGYEAANHTMGIPDEVQDQHPDNSVPVSIRIGSSYADRVSNPEFSFIRVPVSIRIGIKKRRRKEDGPTKRNDV